MRRPVPTHQASGERGFALLLVFLLAAVVGIMLYRELPRVAFDSQRQKEQMLMERGEQFQRAIQLYTSPKGAGHYPASLDDLENFQGRHFLRHRYKDPMTGKDEWRLIHVGPNGMLTDSILNKPKGDGSQPGNDPAQYVAVLPSLGGQNADGLQSNVSAATRRRVSEGGTAQLGPDGQPVVATNPNGVADPTQLLPGQGSADPNNPNPSDPAPINHINPGGLVPGQINAGLGGPSPYPGAPMPPGIPGMPGMPGMAGIPGVPGQVGIGVGNVPAGVAAGASGSSSNGDSGYITANPGLGSPAPTAAPTQVQQVPQQYPGQPGQVQYGPQPGSVPFGQQAGFNQQQQQQQQSAANLIGSLLTQPRPGGLAGLSGQPGGQTLGGGIAGVASTQNADSIMVYNDRTNYGEWEFIWDPTKWKPPPNPLQGTVGTSAAQLGSGMGGAPGASPFGASPGAGPGGGSGISGTPTGATGPFAVSGGGATQFSGNSGAAPTGQVGQAAAPANGSTVPLSLRPGQP